MIRNDVRRRAGAQLPDGEHYRVEGVEPSGDVGVQRGDRLGQRRHRVKGLMRTTAVPAAAREGHLQHRVGRHDRSGTAERQPVRLVGEDVQRIGDVRPGTGDVEQALVEHRLRAAVTFLPRLEHEHDRTGQRVALGAQQPGGSNQSGGVQVVPAGVHGVAGGGEGEPGVFADRQCVHVAAEQHSRARMRAAQNRRHRRAPVPRRDLQREPAERVEHRLLCTGKVQPHFRIGVQLPAQRDQVRRHGRSPFRNRGSTDSTTSANTSGLCLPCNGNGNMNSVMPMSA